jgi:hypothetical protein
VAQLERFQHIEKHPGYDKTHNPNRLTAKELTAIGVSWEYSGSKVEISSVDGITGVPLSDLSGVAIIEDAFDTNGKNRAYVVNSDGSMRFDVKRPKEYSMSLFSDVYYVRGILSFFLAGSSGDFRLSINENDGSISKIDPSR